MNFFGGQSDRQIRSSRISLRMSMNLQQNCDIRNPQDQRAVGYCNFLTTINLYRHVYRTVPTDVMGRTSHLICHLKLRHVFLGAFSVRVSSSLTLRGFCIIYLVVFLRQFHCLVQNKSFTEWDLPLPTFVKHKLTDRILYFFLATTSMRRITTFRLTTDRLYDSGPIRL